MSLRSRSAPVDPTRRLGRAATFAFGAAIAASTACSGGVDGVDAGHADAGSVVDSGADGTDAGPDGTDAGPDGTDAGPDGTDAGPDGTDAGFDAGGGITPLYGGIPSDAGIVNPDAGFDAGGGITPLYGGIPLLDGGLTRPDAGPIDAGGGITPLYGGSPSS